MSLTVDIPQISVTPEAEEDDDHNFLDLAEALTDIEDLYDEIPIKQQKKSKLKIKLECDGSTTDIEDFEASDNEDYPTKIVSHAKPISLDDLDMEVGISDEAFKIQTKNAKGKKKLKTQFSVTQRESKMSERDLSPSPYRTDIENYDTEEDINIKSSTSDIDLNYYVGDDSVSDTNKVWEINQPLRQADADKINRRTISQQKYHLNIMLPNLSDITDVEVLSSDSNGEGSTKKKYKARRRRRSNKKIPVSDVEDIYFSEEESQLKKYNTCKPSKAKYSNDIYQIMRTQTLPVDSDNEDNTRLPFPLCKLISNKVSLKIPDFDTSALTDTEDFESDTSIENPIYLKEVSLDEKMYEGGTQTSTEANVNQKVTYSIKNANEVNSFEDNKTDSDNYQTENEDNIELDDLKSPKGEIKVGFTCVTEKPTNKRTVKFHRQCTLNRKESNEDLTDLEDLDYDDNKAEMVVALVKNDLTDSEDFSDNENIPQYSFDDTDDITLPKPTRNLIILKEETTGTPSIKIMPLSEDHIYDLLGLKNDDGEITDEEQIEDGEDNCDEDEPYRSISPDMPIYDGGSVDVVDQTVKNNNLDVYQNVDGLTDTEICEIDKPKKKKPPTFKYIMSRSSKRSNNLRVAENNKDGLTDTEDVYLSDSAPNNTYTLSVAPTNTDGLTDTEFIETDSDREEKESRSLSCTPIHMREMSGEIIMTRDGSGPFSQKDRLTVLKKIPNDTPCSPMVTDTEDLAASEEDDGIYSRAETATPNQINVLDQIGSSKVHSTVNRKVNYDTPEEVMYLKGGCYIENVTDVEDFLDEDIIDNEIYFQNHVIINPKQLLVNKQEWEASKKPADISFGEKATLEKDAALQDIPSTEIQFITYESVLLTPNRSMCSSPKIQSYLHKTTSYTQIDEMLEKMLNELEQQEKLFGLDLDILEPEDVCVNVLEIRPSTDALIEIPIKKTIKVPKVYQTTQEIKVNEENLYETMIFENKCKQELQEHFYDLINYNDNLINKNVMHEKIDEAAALITETTDDLQKNKLYKYEIQLHMAQRASSESLSEGSDIMEDTADIFMDDNYETIEQRPLTYAYQLYDSRTGNEIWWEGTYRNLSIVPEEEEENASLISKTYVSKPFKNLNNSPLLPLNANDTTSNDSDSESSSFSCSSSEGQYETHEKVIRAEVKLLVKTTDNGKEAIEIHSVKDFLETTEQNKKSIGEKTKNQKSKTLPSKLSDKFSNITKTFSNILDGTKKKSISYNILPDQHTSKKQKSKKPTFTLPRIFIKNPDNELCNKDKNENNLLTTKELSKSKTELFATTKENYPLQYQGTPSSFKEDPNRVDLYANIPFYPCYSKYKSIKNDPFTEFISYPINDPSEIPQPYCDWLIPKEDLSRGKPTTTTQYLTSNEDLRLVDKPVSQPSTGFSTVFKLPNNKIIFEQTNALIQSESLAEPYHTHTDKHYTIVYEKSNKGEKQDLVKTESINKDKKAKKGIFGTIKTFVGKSFDTDSDSEKSAKKDYKGKKDKNKNKIKKTSPEIQKTNEKPKMPSPLIERKEFADMPYFDQDTNENSTIKPPVTATKIRFSDPANSKTVKITEIPKQKQTKIVVVEEITKVFQPVAIEEEEFSIIIDPSKKEYPKKSIETFTLNIDQSISEIEKEILDKSPILSLEKIVKPVVDINAPVPPPRKIKHVYEDIYEPPSLTGNAVITTEGNQYPKDIKCETTNLIKNESICTGWTHDKSNINTENDKPTYSKPSAILKLSKVDQSSDEEILEKQDKEPIKEINTDKKEDKKGLLGGMFGRKTKDQNIKCNVQIPSKELIKKIKDTSGFLEMEVKNYDDNPIIKEIIESFPKEDILPETVVIKEEVFFSPAKKSKSKNFKEEENAKSLEKDLKLEKKESKENSEKKGFLEGVFAKKTRDERIKEDETKKRSQQEFIKTIKDTFGFLEEEVKNYEDVKPIIKETIPKSLPTEVILHETVVIKEDDFSSPAKKSNSKDSKKEEKAKSLEKDIKLEKEKYKEDGEQRKGFLGGLFGKNIKDEKIKDDETKKLSSKELIKTIKETSGFLEEEIKNYEDVTSNIKKTIPKSLGKEVILQETVVIKEDVSSYPSKKSKSNDLKKEEKAKSLEKGEKPEKNKFKEDGEEKKGFLGELFGKKIKEEKIKDHETKKLPSEKLIKTMKNTSRFLEEEVKNYEDVKPFIQVTIPKSIQKEIILHETLVIEEVSSSPAKKSKFKDFKKEEKANVLEKDVKPEKNESKEDGEEKKGFFGGLFGKKIKDEKNKDDGTKKPSKELNKIIIDTSGFLEEEVKNYEDVKHINKETISESLQKKAILQETVVIKEEVSSPPAKKSKSNDFNKEEKAKRLGKDEKLEKKEFKKDGEENKGFLGGLFGKTIKDRKMKDDDTKKLPSEELIKTMKDSSGFLEGEVKNYEDVKPIIKVTIPESLPKEVILHETVVIKEEVFSSPDKKLKSKDYKKEKKVNGLEKDVKLEKKESKEEKKGFLGLFAKKTTDEKIKDDDVKTLLSKELIKTMKDTSGFLEEEVKNYEDVIIRETIPQLLQKEVILQETVVIKEEDSSSPAKKSKSNDFKKEEKTKRLGKDEILEKKEFIEDGGENKGFLGGLFGKNIKERKIKDDVTKKLPSEELIKTMKDTSGFLEGEVKNYEDVKPIIKVSIPESLPKEVILHETLVIKEVFSSPDKKSKSKDYKKEKKVNSLEEDVKLEKNESKEEKKGFLGLFAKKTTDEKIKDDDKKLSSKELIKTMKDTSGFLEEEVKNYEDVIIKETIPQQLQKAVILQETVVIKEEVSSSSAKKSKSNDFNKEEKAKRLEKDEKLEKKKCIEDGGENKGFLGGLFGKNIKERKTKDDVTKKLPSEELIKTMKDTSGFLEEEVKNYEDVKPIIKVTIPESLPKEVILHETLVIKEEVFSSPDKKSKPKDYIKENKVNSLEEDVKLEKNESKEEKKGFLGLFSKKTTDEKIKDDDKKLSSKELIKTMKDTSGFLEEEVKNYQDVIIKETIPELLQKEVILQETVVIKEEVSSSPAKMSKSNDFKIEEKAKPLGKDEILEKKEFIKDGGENKGFLGGLFSKNIKERKIKDDVTKKLPSEELIKTMKETSVFLEEEVENYEDVKPIIKVTIPGSLPKEVILHETLVIKEEVFSSPDKKSKSKDYKKEKKVNSLEEDVKLEKKESKEEKKGFLGLFAKKATDEKIKDDDKKLSSKELIKTMKDTSGFLEEEVKNYQDVIIKETIPELLQKEVILQETIVIKEEVSSSPAKKSKSNDFKEEEKEKRLGKDEKLEKKEFIKDGEENKGFLGGLFRKNIKDRKIKDDETKKLLSKELIKTMKDTSEFLEKEVKNYEDVKPIFKVTIPESLPKEVILHETVVIKEVYKKEKQVNSLEQDENIEFKEEKKGFLGLFPKKTTDEKIKDDLDKKLPSNELIETMRDTSEFLDQEVKNHKDVKPIFKEKIPKVLLEEVILHEPVVIKEEVLSFPAKKSKSKDSKKEEKAKSLERDVDGNKVCKEDGEENKGFFGGIFGKKTRGEKIKDDENKKVLSEELIKTIKYTSGFLEHEVKNHEDVKPIIKETIIESLPKKVNLQEVSFSPVKKPTFMDSKKGEKEKSFEFKEQGKEKKGVFGALFGEKTKDEKIINHKTKELLSEELIKTVKDTSGFLEHEVKHHEDVKPIIKETIIESLPKEVILPEVSFSSAKKTKIMNYKKGKKAKSFESKEEIEEKKGFFGGLFGKKTKDEKMRSDKVKELTSEELIKTMKDTSGFLEQEVKHYEDVKPSIKETINIEVSSSPVKKSKKEAKTNSLEKDVNQKVKGDGEEKKIFLGGLFGKKTKDLRINGDEQIKPIPSEDLIKIMEDSSNFLNEEVKNYQDVKLIDKQSLTGAVNNALSQKIILQDSVYIDEKNHSKEQSSKTNNKGTTDKDEHEKDDKFRLFGIFSKKTHDKNVVAESNFEKVTTTDKCATTNLPEEAVKNITNSSNFLLTEQQNYEDGQDGITKKESKQTIISKIENYKNFKPNEITQEKKDDTKKEGKTTRVVTKTFESKLENVSPELFNLEKSIEKKLYDLKKETSELNNEDEVDFKNKPDLTSTTKKQRKNSGSPFRIFGKKQKSEESSDDSKDLDVSESQSHDPTSFLTIKQQHKDGSNKNSNILEKSEEKEDADLIPSGLFNIFSKKDKTSPTSTKKQKNRKLEKSTEKVGIMERLSRKIHSLTDDEERDEKHSHNVISSSVEMENRLKEASDTVNEVIHSATETVNKSNKDYKNKVTFENDMDSVLTEPEMVNSETNLISEVMQTFDNKLSSVKNESNEIEADLKKKSDKITMTTNKSILVLEEKIKDVENIISEVQYSSKQINDDNKYVSDTPSILKEKTVDFVEEVKLEAKKESGGFLDKIKKKSKTTKDNIDSDIAKLETKLDNTGEMLKKSESGTESISIITDQVKDIKESKGFFGKLGDKLSGKDKKSKQDLEDNKDATREELNYVKEYASKTFKEEVKATSELVIEVDKNNVNLIKETKSNISQDICNQESNKQLKDVIKDCISDTKQYTNYVEDENFKRAEEQDPIEKDSELGNKISKQTNKIKDKVESKLDKIGTYVEITEKDINESSNETKNIIDDIEKDAIKEPIGAKMKETLNITKGETNSLISEINQQTKFANDAVSDFINDAKQHTECQMKNEIENVKRVASDINNDGKFISDEIRDNALKIKNKTEKEHKKLKDLKQDIEHTVKESKSELKKTSKETGRFLDKLGTKITKNTKKIKDKFSTSNDNSEREIAEYSKQITSQTKNDMYNLQKDILIKNKKETKESAETEKIKCKAFLEETDKKKNKGLENIDLKEIKDNVKNLSAETVEGIEKSIKTEIKDLEAKLEEAIKETAAKVETGENIEKYEGKGKISGKENKLKEEIEEKEDIYNNKQSDQYADIKSSIKHSLEKISVQSKETYVVNVPNMKDAESVKESYKQFETDVFKDKEELDVKSREINDIPGKYLESARNLSTQDSFSKMTRAVSDNMGNLKSQTDNSVKISEANIDLSNLSTNVEYSEKSTVQVSNSFITSPTSIRRHASQKVQTTKYYITDVSNQIGDFGPSGSYTVTEPEDIKIKSCKGGQKKALFHIESEEDDSLELSHKQIYERRDSVKSNILESLTENKIDTLLSNLTQSLKEATSENPLIKIEKKVTLETNVMESQKDVDIIEKKLSDLDKALDSLEQIDIQVKSDTQSISTDLSEKKLRRIERKFEKMASEVLDKDVGEAKEHKLTTPEAEAIQEQEFDKLVSQISVEDVSDFQREFSQILDETTFSKTEDGDSKTPDSHADVLDLPQEISCGQLTEANSQLTTTETKIPQPKPRSAKIPETPLQFSINDEQTMEKQISPVRDDLLDDTDQAETLETYSDKKNFWENVSKDNIRKSLSIQEISLHEKETLSKKRASVHELGAPPVPKPRAIFQQSQSLSEEKDDLTKLSILLNRAVSVDSTPSESSGMAQTELTRISESDDGSIIEEKIMTEYQAQFQPPFQVKPKMPKEEEKNKTDLEKTDSLDSDKAQKGSSQFIENSGYISDSEDVEHYISDSEIEDRVPQIRERQMSVFAPPVASTRKSIYERSASLPTEDLYEVSARSIKLRKQYYEEQIKKEMIEEQLTSEIEDDPSPERKQLTISNQSSLREEEELLSEIIEELPKQEVPQGELIKQEVPQDELTKRELPKQELPKQSVKDLAKGLEVSVEKNVSIPKPSKIPIKNTHFVSEHLQGDKNTKEQLTEKSTTVKNLVSNINHKEQGVINETHKTIETEKIDISSVKSLAKSYEKQLGSVVAGQKIGQASIELKGFVLDKSEISKTSTISNESFIVNNIVDSLESDKRYDEQNLKEDSASKLCSMEVHVDKSELENSEKLSEFDHDDTNIETKSIESFTTEPSPKTSHFPDDYIPEITVTLSGKQRRISEESDDYVERIETVQTSVSPIPEISSIKQSEEHIEETVWEVPIQSEIEFSEKVTDIVSDSVSEVKQTIQAGPSIDDDKQDISYKDESDLTSDIHQDRSDSLASDKIKSESSNDIEKIILDSLHQQQVDPEEAKKMASALVREIESEIEKNESISYEVPYSITKASVSDYLRQLAEAKGLDEREVELVESVLARRQRELSKLVREDTQASSMEITDEDLKFSGAELDYSHILEQQMDQLEAEKLDIKIDYDSVDESSKHFQEKSEQINKIDEAHTEEKHISKDLETYADSKIIHQKNNITVKVSESIKGEKSAVQSKDIIFEEDETISESATDDSEKFTTDAHVVIKDETIEKCDDKKKLKTETLDASAQRHFDSKLYSSVSVKDGKDIYQEIENVSKECSDSILLSAKNESQVSVTENFGDMKKEIDSKTELFYNEKSDLKEKIVQEQVSEVTIEPDGSKTTTVKEIEKQVTETKSNIVQVEHHESKSVVTTTLDNLSTDLKIFTSEGKLHESPQIIERHVEVKRTLSSDSKSSIESEKNIVEPFLVTEEPKVTEKETIILRKAKSDAESSSGSSNLKGDRKSGIEFEVYSSSGESHYQSFEIDSGKSRPCSSDVEGLVAAGSSEYESALTSQMLSGKSHITSTEYQTAVSSLSSKESMKSLDSESSGNLASIEVSEVSETLIPSTSDMDGDMLDLLEQQLEEDKPSSDWIMAHAPIRQSTEVSESYSIESIDISEKDNVDSKDVQSKMKRSYEMTFQPEPIMLIPELPQKDSLEADDKLGVSMDDGSVLSMSMSSTSSNAAVRTVIELSKGDEGSMTVSGTSEHLSIDDVENISRGSQENLMHSNISVDTSTCTPRLSNESLIESVTITTSSVNLDGIKSVSTQVRSQTQETTKDEPKKKGHRRQESNFVASMINVIPQQKVPDAELTDNEKPLLILSAKEGKSDEKKDIDESEKDSYDVEIDQVSQRGSKLLDGESDFEVDTLDFSRPQSQFSKSDSERPTSTAFSDDRPDSELAELIIKSSDAMDISDPIERPLSPEPCDETKDDTPEFSSEAQASVGELEQEYSSAVARSHEIYSETSLKRHSKELTDIYIPKQQLEKRDSHGKSSTTSSEKSSFDEAEAEAAFSMVAHISPAHKIKQICPILEDEDAEKHELETRERAQKEFEQRRAQIKDQSPGFIPDIKVTQHMTPLIDKNFRYPDLELEAKEKQTDTQMSTPQTPASNSSKSSEETDQGREYVLEDMPSVIPEEGETTEEKAISESKSEVVTVVESTLKEESEKGTDSPSSDSFEMLEKPDLIDDFVVIEEVAKEAHEFDSEGKSVKIQQKVKKTKSKHDTEVEEYLVKSAPTPLTRISDIKYYPDGSSSDELGFEFEDSPPQDSENSGSKRAATSKDYVHQYDRELEANKKWIEQQFQGDHAAMLAAGYGYEMEFERGPLEDIKEEDITDFEASSRIGSLGSQKESGGSLGSVKDSYSSTPDYDVLAGRKYFTRSGEHDDISMSSLQEFENLEQAMSLEMRKYHGSQDSSSNGSYKNRHHKSQGDDISVSSLKEFEGLEKACIAAHKIEVKVQEEEEMLAQIDECPESLASESESCETISGTQKLATDSDEEDYEKRMFEIDEIIRQAQTNVERFIDLKEAEKTESLGRGDSIEEVSRVPELDLDAPLKSNIKVQWKETDDVMITSTDSLDLKPSTSNHGSTDSLDQKTGVDLMTASTDSIEVQAQKSKNDNIMTDSIEVRGCEQSGLISSDSLELGAAAISHVLLTDSIDEDGSRIYPYDISISSTSKDCSARDEFVDQSVTSSTATHATYQYETDSILSGSFTSGGSNTMVSSTETVDPMHTREFVDVSAAVRKVWFDEEASGGKYTEYVEDNLKPYVTEVIEPSEDDSFSHTIHRRVEMPSEMRKVTFTGADAKERLRQFIEDFGEGEDVQETNEVDEHGNVHIKKVVQKRFIIKTDDSQPQTSQLTNIEQYKGQGVVTKPLTDSQGTITILTEQFDIPQISSSSRVVAGEEAYMSGQDRGKSSAMTAEKDETQISGQQQTVTDQHKLSDEMKALLQELEKESKQ